MGGNLGDVAANMQSALAGMAALPATGLLGASSLYQSRPVDADGPDYLNAVAVLQSALGPHELLRALQALEHAHDRQRRYHNAPRTLDLDLLWYGSAVRNSLVLTLPHPRMMARAFVLEPLAELLDSLACEIDLQLPDESICRRLAQDQGIARLDVPGWPRYRSIAAK